MSAYEQLRMEKLKRNLEVMAELGLGDSAQVVSPSAVQSKRAKQHNTPPPPSRQQQPAAALPTRRSTRIAKTTPEDALVEMPDPGSWRAKLAASSPSPATTGRTREEEEEEEVEYVKVDAVPSAAAAVDAKLIQWETQGDGALKKMYSLDFHASRPELLAAGGHGGRVAVFSTHNNDDDDDAVVLSFQPTKSWVSRVKFAGDNLLLVSSNDGNVGVFDHTLVSSSSSSPKPLFTATNLHAGKGIFDLALSRVVSEVATCGKDGSVAQSTLTDAGELVLVRRIAQAHRGVCKTVAFPDSDGSTGQVVCSAGNDAVVRLWDFRDSAGTTAQVSMPSRFNLAINNVQFSPQSDHLVLSSSFAPVMELHDVRFPDSSSVREFAGHCPPSTTTKQQQRVNSIYQPVMLNNGRILASGGGSTAMTTFDSATGEILARQELGWEPNATTTGGGGRVAVSHGARVSVMSF